MSREITGDVSDELAAKVVRPIVAVELDFESGFVRMWSGVGPITINGQTYFGAGNMGKITPVKESAGFQANGATVGLAGIPTALLSVAFLERYQGRAATIYLAFVDDAGAIIADPFVLFRGRMDTMTIEKSAETCTIALNVESRAIALKRTNERRWTDQDQKIDYPNDRGFEYVTSLADQEITWVLG